MYDDCERGIKRGRKAFQGLHSAWRVNGQSISQCSRMLPASFGCRFWLAKTLLRKIPERNSWWFRYSARLLVPYAPSLTVSTYLTGRWAYSKCGFDHLLMIKRHRWHAECPSARVAEKNKKYLDFFIWNTIFRFIGLFNREHNWGLIQFVVRYCH